MAPQALYLLNDPFVRRQALNLADRLLDRADEFADGCGGPSNIQKRAKLNPSPAEDSGTLSTDGVAPVCTQNSQN